MLPCATPTETPITRTPCASTSRRTAAYPATSALLICWALPRARRRGSSWGVWRRKPRVAVDVSADPFLFDAYLVKKPADTVVVPVQGDSMIEAGIFEGDLAVVERKTSA